jgi:MerR family transcriptional regulator/heat shock protein HspR
LVSVHPRTLRTYEGEGLVRPARTPTNIRLYSENDLRRVLWIRHLTQNLGVNLAGVRVLFELEERLGMRILETLYSEPGAVGRTDGRTSDQAEDAESEADSSPPSPDRTAKEI